MSQSDIHDLADELPDAIAAAHVTLTDLRPPRRILRMVGPVMLLLAVSVAFVLYSINLVIVPEPAASSVTWVDRP